MKQNYAFRGDALKCQHLAPCQRYTKYTTASFTDLHSPFRHFFNMLKCEGGNCAGDSPPTGEFDFQP